jgi:hypothetical protein
MTTAPLPSRIRSQTRRSSSLVQRARVAYALLAWLFVGGVILQVFLAGLALMVDPLRIEQHRTLGHLVLLIPCGLLAAGLFARLPRRQFGLTALLLGLSLVHSSFVYVPANGDADFLRAFHLVNTLLLFWLGIHLTRRAGRLSD